MLNKSKAFAVLLLVVMFGAGVAVGSAVSAAWGGDHDDDGRERRDRRPRRSYTEMLAEELQLTPTQQDSVRAILGRRERAMREMWQQMEPRFDSLREQIRAEILAQLDPQQQRKYQALIARSDSLQAARDAERSRRNGGTDRRNRRPDDNDSSRKDVKTRYDHPR